MKYCYDEYIDPNGSYVIEIEAPGISKDDVHIKTEKKLLLIIIKSVKKREEVTKKYVTKMIREKELKLKRIIPSTYSLRDMDVTYKNGIIRIVIPLKKERIF